jgi:predicted PurR-regulated permease PerM
MIDNILRPKLVGRDTEMHPLMVFFATLGGISFFGLPGFIIGPIIVSLFLALGEIYGIEFRNQLNEYNND